MLKRILITSVMLVVVLAYLWDRDRDDMIVEELDVNPLAPPARGPGGKNGDSAYKVWLKEGNTGSEADFLASLEGGKGDPGDSAYQVWLDAGNTGSEADFLASIEGDKGDPGDSAYQVWLDEGNTGSEADFLASLEGDAGPPGPVAGEHTHIIFNFEGEADGDPDLRFRKTKNWDNARMHLGEGDLYIDNGCLALSQNPSVTAVFGKAKLFSKSFPDDLLFVRFGASEKQIAFLTPNFTRITSDASIGVNQSGQYALFDSALPLTITLSIWQGSNPLILPFKNIGGGQVTFVQPSGAPIGQTVYAQGEGSTAIYIPQGLGTSQDNNWLFE